MHTKDLLAQALRACGLDSMAEQAASGYYHDYLSPLDLPEIVLVNDLNIAAINIPERREPILALRERVIGGEFDASEAEAEEWGKSPEGQETMRRLGMRDKT